MPVIILSFFNLYCYDEIGDAACQNGTQKPDPDPIAGWCDARSVGIPTVKHHTGTSTVLTEQYPALMEA